MTLLSITLSCKTAASMLSSKMSMLTQLLEILVMSHILVGIMITGSKSQATGVNTLLVAGIVNLISMEILRPSISIRNGKDRYLNSRRFKIAYGSGSLPSYPRLSTFPVFKSLVCYYSSIMETIN